MNTKTSIIVILLFICALAVTSCRVQQLSKKEVSKLIGRSSINADHFTGFALYDMKNRKMIYDLNGDKYFTPASNTKLFTFYTALSMLGDSIPGLRYVTKGDSLIFWGTGDPSFLHTTLRSTKAYDLLKNSKQKLYYASGNYSGNFYGTGWPYGDYSAYYQAEINALPIEDNVAVLSPDSKGAIQISPVFLKMYLKADSSFHPKTFTVERDLMNNTFRYPLGIVPRDYKEEIPWKTSDELTLALLQDTLKRPLKLISMQMPETAKILYGSSADSVYKKMLLPSDNFIAEQLLLVCSSKLPGPLNTEKVIEYSKKNFLKDLPQEPQWADGSGLSRHNLFTPFAMIALLQKIWNKVGDENRLLGMLPAGGVSGTLKSAYKTDNGKAFVWAKTGSLSNNHNQSGYIVTRKGRKLIYSYMNNNFTRPTADIRAEMVRIITEIHNRF